MAQSRVNTRPRPGTAMNSVCSRNSERFYFDRESLECVQGALQSPYGWAQATDRAHARHESTRHEVAFATCDHLPEALVDAEGHCDTGLARNDESGTTERLRVPSRE